MSVAVAQAVADEVLAHGSPVTILWHGGEPLMTGVEAFSRLLEPFEPARTAGVVRHSLQTNATLITTEWCDLFRRYEFRVGVSLDGEATANGARVDWAGKPAFARALAGARLLAREQIDFHVIAVVNPRNVSDAEQFYRFFQELGPSTLCINVEEAEGLNRNMSPLPRELVRSFWADLFRAWAKDPSLAVREFDDVLGWMEGICEPGAESPGPMPRNMWPSIATNGDVVVISPELNALVGPERAQFVVGNVLEHPLTDLVQGSAGRPYVRDFLAGVQDCSRTCEYYSFCGGGQASNKFFELGSTRGTVTRHCTNTRQLLVDAVLGIVADQN
jgi:uncharacterized protein